MKNAIIYLLVFAALQSGVSLAVKGVWELLDKEGAFASMDAILVTSMALASLVVLAVFLLAKWSFASRSYMRSAPWVQLFWCMFAAIGVIVPSAYIQELLPELPDFTGDELEAVVNNHYGYYVIALLAPIAEETVFRGAILRSLLGWAKNHWTAIAVSALLFALVHVNPAQMPHAFCVGLLLGWLYYRTRSVIPGIAFHWVNNTVAFALARIMPTPDAPLVTLFGTEQRVLMAVGCSLLILVPSIYQLNLRLKQADA